MTGLTVDFKVNALAQLVVDESGERVEIKATTDKHVLGGYISLGAFENGRNTITNEMLLIGIGNIEEDIEGKQVVIKALERDIKELNLMKDLVEGMIDAPF